MVQTKIEDRRIAFVQSDPQPGRSLHWTERLDVVAGTAMATATVPLEIQNERTDFELPSTVRHPQFILPTGGGLAYGDFVLDDGSRTYLLHHLPELTDPLTRGAAWVTLWEEMLDRRVDPLAFISAEMTGIERENTEQNVQLMLRYLDDTFWTFLSSSQRQQIAPKLERTLRAGIDRSTSSTMKSTYFSAFRSTATTRDGIGFVERIWRRQEKIPGLMLAEPDEATMALELAVRAVPDAAAILDEQRGRFMNPDRKARFEFVMPALSERPDVRDAWFQKLSDVKNRRREPWVIEGLRYLHHPLRAAESEKYIKSSLDLLHDIQQTGDIFFPKNWMDATLGGHHTASAAKLVRDFLSSQEDYPIRLRRIILQSADELFRASER
jgi:aminopeptidase N